MISLTTTLKLLSPVFVLVGLIHLALGPEAEVLLGAELSPQSLADPVLDSQNRFYGVTFTVFGFLLYLCATDIHKYAAVFYICIWVIFAGGVARLISMAAAGIPSGFVIALLAVEILAPVLLTLWYRNVQAES